MAELPTFLIDGQDVPMDALRAYLTRLSNTASAALLSAVDAAQPYATLVLAQAAPAVAAGRQARVYADPDPAKNGLYVNASGAVGGYALDTGFYSQLAAVAQPLVAKAMLAGGFATLTSLQAYASQMVAGDRTIVSGPDAGTHAAIAGDVAFGGAAATVGAQIPNEGIYAKQASGALWRVADTAVQATNAARDQALAAADSTSALPVVNAALDLTRNIFDRARAVDNTVVNRTTGATSTLNGFYLTPRIDVVSGQSIVANVDLVVSGNSGPVFRNTAGAVITPVILATITAGTAITVPAGARTFQAFFAGTAATSSVGIYNGTSLPASHREFGSLDRLSTQRAILQDTTALLPDRYSIVDPARMVPGAIRADNGVALVVGGFMATDFIPVEASGFITTNGLPGVSSAAYGLAFYDRGGNTIPGSGIGGASVVAGTPIAVPARAAFVRASCSTANVEVLWIVRGSTLPPFMQRFPGRDALRMRRWAGKKIAVTGDSVTAANVWQQAMCEYLGATLDFNNGTSGARFADKLASVTSTALANSDLALVFLGTNNFGSSAQAFGARGDAVGANTFYGDVRAMIEAHYTAKPTIRLGVMTPLYRATANTPNSATGKVLLDYVDAIRAVAADYGTPVLDLYRQSGFNPITITTYTADGLHPITAGGAGYAVFQNLINKWAEAF